VTAGRILAGVVVLTTGLTLVAQTPAAPPGTQGSGAPAVQSQDAGRGAPQAPGVPPTGTQPGGRGGRGGLGGPGRDDPANAGVDYSPKPPVKVLPPADELKHFQLQTGYRVELVLAEPDIAEPAAITFDGNGRMYVTEIRSYMNDADGTDTLTPTGRISRHEDVDNDGVYERHTVFVDKLTFPRFAMPLGADAILTKNSNDPDVWKYTDTNGDGVADKRELFATDFGRGGNVEHQESHLTWAMDNWLYSTYNAVRLRWTPHGVLREPIGSPGGAWGVTQDNDGKIWIQGGASGQPGYYQLPLAYGNFAIPGTTDPALRTTWGAPVRIADMQPGMPSVRMPDGSLHTSTAGAGGDIFRGHRLPQDLVGDYFYGEVVARIVRRIKPDVREGITYLTNAYPNSEFIRHTDPLFRSVDQATAPDGTMYLVDMYRGIIQESQWTRPGTYLRAKIEQYQLDKVTDHGRIWRLKYDGLERDRTQPRMLNETPAQLVRHLAHPNGWWRDTAQQLLVLKQDKSVVPALQRIVRTSQNLLERFHALWSLEGLGALDPGLAREMMKDPNPRMRIQAIRASETLFKGGDRSFANDYRAMTKDANTDVVIQAMLTVNVLKDADTAKVVAAARASNPARGVQEFGQQILTALANAATASTTRFTPAEATVMTRGEGIYKELCFTCHGNDGRGTQKVGASAGTTMAPSLASSPRIAGHRDHVIKTLLHGMTGPLDGERYEEVMVPMGSNQDQWIADVASFVRNSFGNSSALVTPADVARVRAATADRTTPWTVEALTASLPTMLPAETSWKVTASHNSETASRALTFAPWSSGAPQAAGMWLQIELPQAVNLTEIQFTSGGGGRGGGGGGAGRAGAGGRGGRGGAGAAAPGAPGQPGQAVQPAVVPPATTAAAAEVEAGDGLPQAGPPPSSGFPRGYQVQVSLDGVSWKPVAAGQGAAGTTAIAFAPVQARFVRMTQTATADGAPPWAMQNLKLFQSGSTVR